MKLIPLSKQGKNKGIFFTMVDNEDFEYLNRFNWFLSNQKSIKYAVRKNNRYTILMHREIMKTPAKSVVDHINHNGLDNRKMNLINCSQKNNLKNKTKRKNTSSKYLGVSLYVDKRVKLKSKRWLSYIYIDGKNKLLGYFKEETDAAKRYNEFAKKYFGNNATLNTFPTYSNTNPTN